MHSVWSDSRKPFTPFIRALCLGGWLISLPALAEGPEALPLKAWQKTLDELEAGIKAPDIGDDTLQSLRQKAVLLREDLAPARLQAEATAATLRQDLEALGSPPEAGQPPEAPAIKAKRKALMDQVALADADTKETELIRSRLDRLVDGIKARRREQFADEILHRSFLPFSAALWAKALPEWVALGGSALEAILALIENLGSLTLGLLLLPFLALIGGYRWILGRFDRLKGAGIATSMKPRVLTQVILDAGLVLGGMGTLLIGIYLGTASGLSEGLVASAIAITVTLLVQRFFSRVLDPEADLIDMAPERALRFRKVASAMALLFGLEECVEGLIATQNASLEVSITNHVVLSLLAAGILVLLVPALKNGLIRSFARFLIIAIVLSILGGFIAMGRLLATCGVLTVGLIVGTRILFRMVESLGQVLLSPETTWGSGLRQRWDLDEAAAERRVFWLEMVLKTLLVMIGFFALLFLWTLDRKDLLIWLAQAFREFQIGSLAISPSAILTGLALFLVLLTGVRALQRFLEEKIFPKTQLDIGMQHSILTGFGYVGIALTAMLSVSVMGVDLSNIAMIAGALSVGIGFGLQNIVNNFVSGLILLIERPIKAGDWVVVGEHQGVVQKISVRATQISTLDRTTVYIPNSSLISGAVQNKTHPDRVGRVVLPLSVDQDQDLEAIRALLVPLADALPEVRKHPAPEVFVTAISETAIQLELVAYVQDVERVRGITSHLYGEILKTFREEGIRRKPAKPQEMNLRVLEIPAPERGI